MGRKGIGKLSMFALSDFVRVTSQTAGGELIAFEVNVPDLKKNLEQRKAIVLDEFKPKPLKHGKGTRIELTKVLKTLNRTETFLRTRLARRFSILGSKHDFRVHLQGKELTEADRNIYDKLQFLWAFDKDTMERIVKLAPNIAETKEPPKEKCQKILPATLKLPDGSSVAVKGL